MSRKRFGGACLLAFRRWTGGGRYASVLTNKDFGPLSLLLCAVGAFVSTGCVELPSADEDNPVVDGVAVYVGNAACAACHPNLAADHERHGHSQALKRIRGAPPTYPSAGTFAGVPAPPEGFEWSDIAYVIGGYAKGANFVDGRGFIVTDAASGRTVSYRLPHLPSSTAAGFEPESSDLAASTGFDYACFRCHTTGAESITENGGLRQDNRAGVGGTWFAAGVQCEACHGPGSRHVSDPPSGNIEPDAGNASCGRCHVHPERPDAFAADGGFIVGNQQLREVEAGPHADFACSVCHDPHASTLDGAGIRNECLDCHGNVTMALHEGRTYVWGDYVERLACESCHMPLASRNATSAIVAAPTVLSQEVASGRIGDTKTHVFYIDTIERDFSTLFSADGSTVVTDAGGKAAIPLDFVCLRCHNGQGNAFPLSLDAASTIAQNMHSKP